MEGKRPKKSRESVGQRTHFKMSRRKATKPLGFSTYAFDGMLRKKQGGDAEKRPAVLRMEVGGATVLLVSHTRPLAAARGVHSVGDPLTSSTYSFHSV